MKSFFVQALFSYAMVITAMASSSASHAAETATEPTLTVAPLFTDRMILQEGMPVPVWGWTTPGHSVTVSFAEQTVTVTAEADGHWEARLQPLVTAAEGRTLTVSDGPTTTIFHDVLVGEVWLCSGQSNMAMRLPLAVGGQEAVKQAGDSSLRLFSTDDTLPWPMPTEPRVRTFAPRAKPYAWQHANPESAADMSAVAWFFAQELRRELKKPVGLILASRGGTLGESWISRQALRAHPKLVAMADLTDRWHEDAPEARKRMQAAQAAWTAAAKVAKAEGKPEPAKPKNEAALGTTSYASGCYNNYIAAIHPFAMRGVIWYQGEGNGDHHIKEVSSGANYERVLTTLITDWRQRWNQEHLHFLIVQLANYHLPPTAPRERDGWSEVRAVQALVADTLPDCGLAVINDLGDAKDIHPTRKAQVGERLSLAARAKVYGQKVVFSGPVLKDMTVSGSTVRLRFDQVHGGLVASSEGLTGFAIAGSDRRWAWADAHIDNDTVILTSTTVANPVAVRYAWAIGSVASLFNGAGLPASPFRTDDWPGVGTGDAPMQR